MEQPTLSHHGIQSILNLWMPRLEEADCSRTVLEAVLSQQTGFEHIGHADFWAAFRREFGGQPLFFSIQGILRQSGHEKSPCYQAISGLPA